MMLPDELTWNLFLRRRFTLWQHAARQLALGIAPAIAIIIFISLLSSRVDIAAVSRNRSAWMWKAARSTIRRLEYEKTGTIDWADCTALEIATYGENDVVSVLASAKQPIIPTETPASS